MFLMCRFFRAALKTSARLKPDGSKHTPRSSEVTKMGAKRQSAQSTLNYFRHEGFNGPPRLELFQAGALVIRDFTESSISIWGAS